MKLIINLLKTLLATITLCSCTTSLISLPEIPKQDCPELPKAIKPEPPKNTVLVQEQCPSMIIPDPIPKKVYLVIENGKVQADDGGAKLLRNYAAIRKTIKRLWHD